MSEAGTTMGVLGPLLGEQPKHRGLAAAQTPCRPLALTGFM